MVVTTMASLRSHPKSRFWIACFSRSDGSRTQRTTRVPISGIGGGDTKAFQTFLGKVLAADVTIKKSPDTQIDVGPKEARKLAQRIADAFEETARTAATGRLIESQARKVVGDIHLLANGKPLASSTVQDFLDAWLVRKEVEAGSKTHAKYSSVVHQFKQQLGPKVRRDLTAITASDITSFRNALVKRVTVGTTNVALKIIRSAFSQARRDGLIDVNEAERVSLLKRNAGAERFQRRAFTIKELKAILGVANDEWRGLILFGLYTGQRLGDIASLTWNNVDLQRSELRLVTEKTGRQQILPLAPPLLHHIETLPAGDTPDAPIFPRTYATAQRHKYAGNLSNQFYDILVSAGMATKRTHKADPKKPKGRSARREQNEVSFHSLRHTATTLLKNAGVSEAVAMEFVGHDSKSVSRLYTHIPTEMLKVAAEKMPDVTQ
jgi:integrase